MKLILHGALRRYGDSIDMCSTTVADAIEGFSRQVELAPGTLLEAVGFNSEEALLKPTDVVEVHLVPALFGGGKFGTFLIAAVEITAGIILLSTGSPLGIPLIVAGATTAIAGVINLFIKAPSVSRANDPPSSKFLGLDQNTTKSGTPITLAWGRNKLFGQYLSIQSESSQLVSGVFPTTTS